MERNTFGNRPVGRCRSEKAIHFAHFASQSKRFVHCEHTVSHMSFPSVIGGQQGCTSNGKRTRSSNSPSRYSPRSQRSLFMRSAGQICRTSTRRCSVVPVKIAYMQVYISYKTWLLGIWPISRLLPERFTLFPTSSGYRWVKGQYAP